MNALTKIEAVGLTALLVFGLVVSLASPGYAKVILPAGTIIQLGWVNPVEGRVFNFTVGPKSGHLVGAWKATAPTLVVVSPASEWSAPNPGIPLFKSQSGTLNETLSPGEYGLIMLPSGADMVTVTQAIQVVYSS